MLGSTAGGLSVEVTSALIGGGAGVLAYGLLNWNERRIRRDRFRRSLIFEIRHVGEAIEQLEVELFGDEGVEPETATVRDGALCRDELRARLSTDLLDAELRSIGKLRTTEIRHVYRFYEASRVIARRVGEGTLDRGDTTLHDQIAVALDARDNALDSIRRSRLSRLTEWYKDVEARR
ncbi:hypothetical protein [Halorubrum sp. BV1]|uniref:hypothetical protein n=1 Tax=Halorubrum sp. BV1 TaxID=1498500 RepID=UPI0006790840|nr:hypothetical protein [Halorubrum sp. BV1]